MEGTDELNLIVKASMYGMVCVISAMLACVIFRTRGVRRFTLGAGLAAALAGLFLLNNYPVDYLLFSFPTPEDVAGYACPNQPLGIICGEHSALVVYQDDENAFCTMISPKTEQGYRVGGLGSDRVARTAKAGGCSVTVRESRRCPDRYVNVFGVVPEGQVVLSDSLGSRFTTMTYPFSAADSSMVVFAAAYLEKFDPETYTVVVETENGAFTASFRETEEKGCPHKDNNQQRN